MSGEKKLKIKLLQWKYPPPCLIFKCFKISAVQNSICNKDVNYMNWVIYLVIKLLQQQPAYWALFETFLGQPLLALIQESLIPVQTKYCQNNLVIEKHHTLFQQELEYKIYYTYDEKNNYTFVNVGNLGWLPRKGKNWSPLGTYRIDIYGSKELCCKEFWWIFIL